MLSKIKKRLYKIYWGYSRKLRSLKREIKYFYQRRTRGWDDSETWSLDFTTAKWILPRLKRLKEVSLTSEEQWYKDVDEMIFAFEHAANEENMNSLPNDPDYIRAKKGLVLFAERYFTLWW